MERSIKIALLLFLSAVFLLDPVFASTWTIQDNYRGGSEGSGYLRNDKDVVSGRIDGNDFDIDWMNVDITGTTMTVGIHTDYYQNIAGHGTTYGDLFLSIDGWDPHGDDPYYYDTNLNGETWEYAFDVSEGALYDISEAQESILLSDDVFSHYSSRSYRHNQEVLIDTIGLEAIGYGSAMKVDDYYTMSFDIAAMSIDLNNFEIGIHWSQTCGNDVIEGEIAHSGGGGEPIPEPATMFLLCTGLLGIAGLRKKLGKKS